MLVSGEKYQVCVNNSQSKATKSFLRDCIGVTPDGALPLFIGGGDRHGGEGVPKIVRSEE